MIQLLKQLIKYIPLLIKLRLTEWHYNLLMFYKPCENLAELVELRQKIEEIRDKIKEI